jgi:hypothetical protein
MTMPVTTIDGQVVGQVVVGFDQKRFASLLGSN